MAGTDITLKVLDERFAICKVDNKYPIPMWVLESRDFYSITRTHDEMSIVSMEDSVPDDVEKESGWKAFKIEGELDFSLVGVISSITGYLAEKEISVFVMSTYNTDYILVKEEDFEKAVEVLYSKYKLV
ncbi:MAG: ACT domain-containing protein [Halanaerobiales bacterium]